MGRSKQNMIGTNLKILRAGGNRYTPIDVEASREKGREVYREEQAYTLQAPDYFRTDIRVSYRKNRHNRSYILSLDIQNLTNRQNVYSQDYDRMKGELETRYQMGLLPVLNYRIEF